MRDRICTCLRRREGGGRESSAAAFVFTKQANHNKPLLQKKYRRLSPGESRPRPATPQSRRGGLALSCSIRSSSGSSWEQQKSLFLMALQLLQRGPQRWRDGGVTESRRVRGKGGVIRASYQMESLVRLRSILPFSCRMMSVFRFPSLSCAEK